MSRRGQSLGQGQQDHRSWLARLPRHRPPRGWAGEVSAQSSARSGKCADRSLPRPLAACSWVSGARWPCPGLSGLFSRRSPARRPARRCAPPSPRLAARRPSSSMSRPAGPGAVLTLARTRPCRARVPPASAARKPSSSPSCVGGSARSHRQRDTGRELGAEPQGERVRRSVLADRQQRVSASCGACACPSRIGAPRPSPTTGPVPERPVTGREVPEGAGIQKISIATVISARPSSLRPYGLSRRNCTILPRCTGPRPAPGPGRHQAGDHDPARLEPAVTRGDDRTEHPFVDPEPSEPLRDDHIDRSRQLDLHDITVQHPDDLRDPVRGAQPLRHGGNRRPLHRVDAWGSARKPTWRSSSATLAGSSPVSSGWTWGDCCELQSLWVEPSLPAAAALATRRSSPLAPKPRRQRAGARRPSTSPTPFRPGPCMNATAIQIVQRRALGVPVPGLPEWSSGGSRPHSGGRRSPRVMPGFGARLARVRSTHPGGCRPPPPGKARHRHHYDRGHDYRRVVAFDPLTRFTAEASITSRIAFFFRSPATAGRWRFRLPTRSYRPSSRLGSSQVTIG